MKVWFPEVDVLKATAILLIVFGHIDNNVTHYEFIRSLGSYNGIVGLSLFFFISGFLLSQTDSVISSLQAVRKFFQKKMIRLFPLYWVALLSLVIIFGFLQVSPGHVSPYDFSPDNLFIHFLGLQGIFPDYSIQSMWFVGVIILFFLIYPFLACLSKDLLQMAAVASCILIVLAILHFFLGLIHINALVYYPAFIAGIFVNKMVYSPKKCIDTDFLKKTALLSLVLVFILFMIIISGEIYLANAPFFKPQLLLVLAMIPFSIFYLLFVHLFIKMRGKSMIILSLIAFGTYAIYLFQHQFLAVFALITDSLVPGIILQDIIILTFGFAGTIGFGILLQKAEHYLFMKYTSARR